MADTTLSVIISGYIVVWIVLFAGIPRISYGVRITQTREHVKARVTDAVVILPCNFTTNTYDSPLITWFRYRGTERRRIMQFKFNTLISYGELLDRVARGDRGALVLIKPTVRDSGKYSCEVQVDKENPNLAIASLTLTVLHYDVNIAEAQHPITAKDSDSAVILPCNFTTDGPVSPPITWHRIRDGHRNKIVTFAESCGLIVGEQFVDRVARGKRGDLVLISPMVQDSGTFTCEVLVDENHWAKIDVNVSVTPDSRDVCTGDGHGGLIFLICVLWIMPTIAGYILEERGLEKMKNIFLQKMSPKQRVMKGWRCIPILLALILIFSGTVCSAMALSSRDNTDFNYYKTAGYGTGILGVVILCGMYICVKLVQIVHVRTDSSCRKATAEGTDTKTDQDLSERVGVEAYKDSTEEPQTNEPDMPTCTAADLKKEKTPLMPQNTISQKHTYEPKPRKMVKPSQGEVTGMVSQSDQDVYMTTLSALFHVDTTDESTEYTCAKDYVNTEQLLMVSKIKNGVMVLAKRTNTRLLPGGKKKEHYSILPLYFDRKRIYNVSSENAISCVQQGRGGDCVYIAYPEIPKVVKASVHTDNIKMIATLNTHILEQPTFIVQNSRGQVIITDSTKHDVFVFEEKTGFVTSMKVSVPKDLEHELIGCNKLAVDTDDRIYVSGEHSKHVFVFGADFRFERVIQTGEQFSGVIACIMIHNNSLYVAHGDCIRVYDLATN